MSEEQNMANDNKRTDFGFWKQFKSGTDIRGVAVEGVVGEGLNLSDDVVRAMVKGFYLWLKKRKQSPLSVAIGRDSRISGPRIMDVALDELSKNGVKVYNCGLASTPSMFMTTVDFEGDDVCSGAIQITASHHPYHRNGLKFFVREGGLESSDIEEILHFAHENYDADLSAVGGSVSEVDYMGRYCAGLRKLICDGLGCAERDKPLDGLHIVVDAGNGAGGFYATRVLKPLGADISGSQFLDPDGMFPNHVPNPEDGDAMKSVCAATVKAGADLGVIFDTDVDRAGCVDASGREVNRNRLIALASVIALENNLGGTIVTDSVTSSGLKIFLEEVLHAKHHRFKRGYKNVINESIRLNNEGILSPLAIETSGHAALKENYFLDDGAYLVTKIIVKAAKLAKEGKTIDDLIKDLKEPAESVELRFNITAANFKQVGENILAGVEKFANEKGYVIAQDSFEGCRISFGEGKGSGWLLLRLSVHDPVMPLNIESDVVGGCKLIAHNLIEHLSGVESLNITSLTKFVS